MPNPENVLPFQFQPGQSGNPSGKPRGRRNRSTIAKMLLESKVDISRLSDKQRVFIETVADIFHIDLNTNPDSEVLITLAQFAKALRGDKKGYDALMDSAWGKPSQPVEMKDSEPERIYDYSKLTDEELSELRSIESRIIELYSKCEIATDEVGS